jgi:hypothetical protein
MYVPSQQSSSGKDCLKFIMKHHPKLASVADHSGVIGGHHRRSSSSGGSSDEETIALTRVKGSREEDFQQALVQLEAKDIHLFQKYKFGVLYVKSGQTHEDQMFSNGMRAFVPRCSFP